MCAGPSASTFVGRLDRVRENIGMVAPVKFACLAMVWVARILRDFPFGRGGFFAEGSGMIGPSRFGPFLPWCFRCR